MHDRVIRTFHHASFDSAKRLLVELDGTGGVAHCHVRSECVITLGNSLNSHVGLLKGKFRAAEVTPKCWAVFVKRALQRGGSQPTIVCLRAQGKSEKSCDALFQHDDA